MDLRGGAQPLIDLIIELFPPDLTAELFPPIFVDAPVEGISYLPIFDGDDDSPQLATVSKLSQFGGAFRPNGAPQVLFALGTISLSSGPIESSLSFDAHFLPILFANNFEATITIAGTAKKIMFQKGVSVVEIPNADETSARQLTLNADNIVALGVVQRPRGGWTGGAFTPHDLGAFAHQTISIAGSHIGAARFLQMLDPDFPREEIVSGVLTESPPEDQEIVISTLAVSWLTETPGLNILSETRKGKGGAVNDVTYRSANNRAYLFTLSIGEFQFQTNTGGTAPGFLPGVAPDLGQDLTDVDSNAPGNFIAPNSFLDGIGYIYPDAETPITISVSGQILTLTVPSKSDAEERLAQGVSLVIDRIAPRPFRPGSPDEITLDVRFNSVMFPYGRPAVRLSLADTYSGNVTFDEKTGEIRFPNAPAELLPDDVSDLNGLDVTMEFSYGSGFTGSKIIRFRLLSDDSPHATP